MPIITTTLVLRLKQKCSQTMKNTSVSDRYAFIGIGTLVQGKEQWLHFAGAAVKIYSTSKVRETQIRW